MVVNSSFMKNESVHPVRSAEVTNIKNTEELRKTFFLKPVKNYLTNIMTVLTITYQDVLNVLLVWAALFFILWFGAAREKESWKN